MNLGKADTLQGCALMNSSNFVQRQFRLGHFIRLSFGIIVVVMVGVGVSSKITMQRLLETSRWVQHTSLVENEIRQLEKLMLDAETGQRGFIFTGDEQFLEPYNKAIDQIDDTFTTLDNLIDDNPEQQARLAQINTLIDQKIAELSQTIDLKRTNQNEALMALVLSGHGKQIMDEARSILQTMLEVEETLMEQRKKSANQAANTANLIALGGTLLIIALSILALVLISQRVIYPIHQVVETLTSSSSNLASSVKAQEASAQQQAAAVQQTISTMDELQASSRQSSEQASVSAAAARQVMTLAHNGTQVVEHTLHDMETIRRKVDVIVNQIAQLQEQAQQVASITNVVSDLAGQTNMLALNAAIEAVRAGSHGKGFSVVATEIRKLADQSKGSAEQIQDLITNIQTAVAKTVSSASDGCETVDQGSEMVKNTVSTFMEVVEAINGVVTSSDQISLNAKQQLAAIQQVGDAMTILNQEAIHNASGVSQTHASAEDLNQAVQQLQAVV